MAVAWLLGCWLGLSLPFCLAHPDLAPTPIPAAPPPLTLSHQSAHRCAHPSVASAATCQRIIHPPRYRSSLSAPFRSSYRLTHTTLHHPLSSLATPWPLHGLCPPAWLRQDGLKKKKKPSRLGDCCSTAASSHPLPPRTLVLPLLVVRPAVLPGCLLSPTSLPDSGCQLSLPSTSAAIRNIHPEHHSSTQAPLPTRLPFPLLSTATTWPFLTSWLHCPPTFIPSFHFVSSRPSRPFPSISHHGFSCIHRGFPLRGFPLHGFPPIMASPPPCLLPLHGLSSTASLDACSLTASPIYTPYPSAISSSITHILPLYHHDPLHHL